MIWTSYLAWAKLDPAFYGALPLVVRWQIFRHTVLTGIAVHYGRPARKWIRQRLPARMLFRRLEHVGNRADGLCWCRATDSRSAQHLADVQPDRDREGHAILREGELMLIDGCGHIRAFVISDDEESIIQWHDGTS